MCDTLADEYVSSVKLVALRRKTTARFDALTRLRMLDIELATSRLAECGVIREAQRVWAPVADEQRVLPLIATFAA